MSEAPQIITEAEKIRKKIEVYLALLIEAGHLDLNSYSSDSSDDDFPKITEE